jgi:formiminotetrahydrofolate cyclodeaminase
LSRRKQKKERRFIKMGDTSDKEKNRRSSKKMYENLDGALGELIDDRAFLIEYLKDLKQDDPRAFNTLLASRLPKAQPVDQDLQKTLLSLKSVMLDLPDVDDIAKASKKFRDEAAFYKKKFENKEEECKLLMEKVSKLRLEAKACQ